MRRAALSLVLVGTLSSGLMSAASVPAAGVEAFAAPTASSNPDPVAQLIAPLLAPASFDPVIGLLGALPSRYRPYTGTLCSDGSPSCIDRVIVEMKRRLDPLARSCSHDAIFSLAYLRVTENVKAAADAGYFSDRRWLTQVDAVFAQMYFDTMDAWAAGRTSSVPQPWRLALQATKDRSMSGLGDFLMNMNAHINNDFPQVLAAVGLRAVDGTSHKRDHNAYNARLDSLYQPVFAEEAARFDAAFDDLDLGPVDELLVGAIMRGWREVVWRHAEALVNAPAALRPWVLREIEEYAAGQARFIKLFFSADNAQERAAYCTAQQNSP